MNSSLSRDEKRYLFEDLFADAIESWFTADIACCDACFDEFVREWPALYLRDIGFQSSVWDLGLIYEGSRLREMYSKEEFWEFVKDIECPRCLSPLKCHIWPYNLPFDPPDGFETAAQQIATIAGVTPFLLLTHPFAFGCTKRYRILERPHSLKFSVNHTTEGGSSRLHRLYRSPTSTNLPRPAHARVGTTMRDSRRYIWPVIS